MGTMAGAEQAGQRAAIEVLDALRPQTLTAKDYKMLKESQSKYEPAAPKVSSGFHIYRWTLLLPGVALLVSWAAFKLRATYGHLLVPRLGN